jgi:hypothetical protein
VATRRKQREESRRDACVSRWIALKHTTRASTSRLWRGWTPGQHWLRESLHTHHRVAPKYASGRSARWRRLSTTLLTAGDAGGIPSRIWRQRHLRELFALGGLGMDMGGRTEECAQHAERRGCSSAPSRTSSRNRLKPRVRTRRAMPDRFRAGQRDRTAASASASSPASRPWSTMYWWINFAAPPRGHCGPVLGCTRRGLRSSAGGFWTASGSSMAEIVNRNSSQRWPPRLGRRPWAAVAGPPAPLAALWTRRGCGGLGWASEREFGAHAARCGWRRAESNTADGHHRYG